MVFGFLFPARKDRGILLPPVAPSQHENLMVTVSRNIPKTPDIRVFLPYLPIDFL